MAAAERIGRGYLGSVLQLPLLPPDIVEKILDGRQSCDLTRPVLLGSVPSVWDEQRSTMAEASGRVGTSAS
jgi:hypothetical protein